MACLCIENTTGSFYSKVYNYVSSLVLKYNTPINLLPLPGIYRWGSVCLAALQVV